jgi:hypothetical protein
LRAIIAFWKMVSVRALKARMKMSKIDRLVAERVMGWPTIDFAANVCNGGYVRGACAYRGADHPTDRCGIWQPSINIADAWEVVERMRSRGFAFDCGGPFVWENMKFAWWCSFCGKAEISHAQTMPIAICLAALRAFDVSEEEIMAACKEVGK